MNETLVLVIFIGIILGILFLDLLVIGRKSHVVSFRESLIWFSMDFTVTHILYFPMVPGRNYSWN